VSARSFWPPREPAQVDYETLRAQVLEPSGLPQGLAGARFARRGLGGLIAWPSAEPVFVAELLGAAGEAGFRRAPCTIGVLSPAHRLRAVNPRFEGGAL
jgi:hypothetical protein